MAVTVYSGRSKESFPFAKYADGKYPLLQIAASNQDYAHSYKIEWLVDHLVDGRWEQDVWENFTQIARTPFTPDPETGDREMWRALERHLQDVENTLWFGTPSYERNTKHGHPLHCCGGVLHYLKRQPLQADKFVLRVLQDCVLLEDRGSDGPRVDEFLSEFSLQINPAQAVWPAKNEQRLNAWAQGSSL